MPNDSGSPTRKYHVALSFAGEDRPYVEKVATQLKSEGVSVFYDGFEESTLWGKNLYTHLSDVYGNKAVFTVMFISEHYKNKLWTNHERESAQARAFENNREYILPAFFDESVKIPGVLKTTGKISLARRTPEELATLIVKKLQESGVELSADFVYSEDAKADADFPRPKGSKVSEILNDLKSYNWYTQNPAIEAIFELDWKVLKNDQTFVLGRNIYQCACGGERTAIAILNDLRGKLALLPADAAAHLLNGMFFEAYFNNAGEFRGHTKVKGTHLDKLLKLQTAKKFATSIYFIHKALQPYKAHLPIIPSVIPEIAEIEMTVKKSNPPVIRSFKLRGCELLIKSEEADEESPTDVWKLSFVKFTIETLKKRLAEAWSIPPEQLTTKCDQKLDAKTEYRLPNGGSIVWPENGLS